MTQGVILTGCVERRPERDSGNRKAKEKLRCCPGQSVWMALEMEEEGGFAMPGTMPMLRGQA